MRGPGDVKFRICLQRAHKLAERLVFKWAFSVFRKQGLFFVVQGLLISVASLVTHGL